MAISAATALVTDAHRALVDDARHVKKLFLLTAVGLLMVADAPARGTSSDLVDHDVSVPSVAQAPVWPTSPVAPENSPNVVLILLDDVGFGATATFGGPAKTPALEELAKHGLRYNRFHVTALCSPTRAALLSGRNDHNAGFGTISDLANGFPGYTGIWNKDTASIAEVLRRNGYSTAAFGKWHNTPFWEISPVGPFDHWPTNLGFEYFYGFMNGMDSQWEPSLYRNTTAVDPPSGFPSSYQLTTDLVNDATTWIQTHETLAPKKPYFVYLAPGATHEPHHVSKEWIDEYRGQFDQGWDKLREQIFERQKRLGVVPLESALTPRPKEIPAWSTLAPRQKQFLARQMEVYAAFLSQTDYEVGRLLKAVQSGPNGSNTLIIYIAGDNGASGEGRMEGHDGFFYEDIAAQEKADVGLRMQHLDGLGSKLYMNHYSTAWAWAMDTPFQWTKQVASHFGGTRDPMIVSWPAKIIHPGELRSQFTHVTDIAATIYDAAGISFPPTVDGVQQKPLDGQSFLNTFDDPSASSRHRTQIFEQVGNRAIYQDGWVAAALHWLPWQWPYKNDGFESDRWELYHVDIDFSEAHDLASKEPEKLRELKALFDTQAQANNVYPLGAGGWDYTTKHQPSPAAGRTQFVFHPGFPRTPSGPVLPNFSHSHGIIARVDIEKTDVEGVIISEGSRHGGFVLYVKNNHLVYENQHGTKHDVIRSPEPLLLGRNVLEYRFEQRAGEKGASDKKPIDSGTGRLFVNGRKVAELEQHGIRVWGSLGIGQAYGSPVTDSISLPFKFDGDLESVTVELE